MSEADRTVQRAPLNWLDFDGVKLGGKVLDGANLTGANFRGAVVNGLVSAKYVGWRNSFPVGSRDNATAGSLVLVGDAKARVVHVDVVSEVEKGPIVANRPDRTVFRCRYAEPGARFAEDCVVLT